MDYKVENVEYDRLIKDLYSVLANNSYKKNIKISDILDDNEKIIELIGQDIDSEKLNSLKEYALFVERNIDLKSDGTPYAERFEESYSKMSEEEKKQADAIIKYLEELMGNEEEDE